MTGKRRAAPLKHGKSSKRPKVNLHRPEVSTSKEFCEIMDVEFDEAADGEGFNNYIPDNFNDDD